MNQPALPFKLDDEGYEETPDEIEEDAAAEAERKRIDQARAAEEEQRRAAQSAVQDMTRGIQKKHEKELKELQFLGGNGGGNGAGKPTPVAAGPKVGRNDPCPCGSGKKYKKCHGVSA